MAVTDSKPSELELQVLAVLWQRGPCTARQVQEALPDRKVRAYTTVLTVMQLMEKKGFLSRRREGMAHVYKATVSRRHVLGPMLRGLVQRVFGGSPSAAVQQLLSETDVSEAELKKIRQVLKDHEQGTKGE